jgi:site-specific DNA-methyltransferase (adenine-specific)
MFDAYSMLTLAPMVRKVFNVKNIIVWDKLNIGMGHYFRRRSEFILFATQGRRALTRRDLPDVWGVQRLFRAPYPTQKPVELFDQMLAASQPPGSSDFVVCDPFAGSGSSALAAVKSGAVFVGCDISRKAVRLANKRIAEFAKSGKDILQPIARRVDLGLRPVS